MPPKPPKPPKPPPGPKGTVALEVSEDDEELPEATAVVKSEPEDQEKPPEPAGLPIIAPTAAPAVDVKQEVPDRSEEFDTWSQGIFMSYRSYTETPPSRAIAKGQICLETHDHIKADHHSGVPLIEHEEWCNHFLMVKRIATGAKNYF